MSLADKIIRHRKKNGWSQEELAQRLDVSRQAVSKWESAQSVPELEKILALASLFGVSTDYLVKDEIEDCGENTDKPQACIRKITAEQSDEYLDTRKRSATMMGVGILLCILSPITLFILSQAAESGTWDIGENLAGIIGLVVMFAFIICALPIFLLCAFRNDMYTFLNKNEDFELEMGVRDLVLERKNAFKSLYVRSNIIATCLCVFAPMPLIISGFFDNDFVSVVMLGVMMIIVGFAVFLYVSVGVRRASMDKLLGEGDYTEDSRKRNGLKETVGFVYWGIISAIYLAWSFLFDAWRVSVIVFILGAILFPVVMSICDRIADKTEK